MDMLKKCVIAFSVLFTFAISIVITLTLVQIKNELSEIKTNLSQTQIGGEQRGKFLGWKLKNEEKFWNRDEKDFAGGYYKAQREGFDGKEWKADKELVLHKLEKLQKMSDIKEFSSAEEKDEFIKKVRLIKDETEKDDADYNALFKEVKQLFRSIK
jgi:hypothetical protein